MDFKYSIANILLGLDNIFPYLVLSFIIFNTAFSLAFGYETPFFNSSCNKTSYSFGSCTNKFATLFSAAISPVSVPKEIDFTIFILSNIFIVPDAKFSALDILYNVGNSITKFTPHFNAISAFFHLFITDVFPL